MAALLSRSGQRSPAVVRRAGRWVRVATAGHTTPLAALILYLNHHLFVFLLLVCSILLQFHSLVFLRHHFGRANLPENQNEKYPSTIQRECLKNLVLTLLYSETVVMIVSLLLRFQ